MQDRRSRGGALTLRGVIGHLKIGLRRTSVVLKGHETPRRSFPMQDTVVYIYS